MLAARNYGSSLNSYTQQQVGYLKGFPHMYTYKDAALQKQGMGLDTIVKDFFHMTDCYDVLPHNAQYYPASIAIMEIVNLKLINETQGYTAGNEQIQKLSHIVKKYVDNKTYLIRDFGPRLAIIKLNCTECEMVTIMKTIQIEYPSIDYGVRQINSFDNVNNGINEALENLRLSQILNSDNEQFETFQALLHLLEEIDTDTQQHVSRTQKLGQQLAQKINLPLLETAQLSLLCCMHDIGKTCIPLEILNKKGILTSSEMELMRSHAVKGESIIKQIPSLKSIAPMVRWHHEQWNGQGYPDKLAGEQIHIFDRIVSLVDAYDAMANDRVYRHALYKEDIIKEIERCSGEQFDPHLARIFLEMINS